MREGWAGCLGPVVASPLSPRSQGRVGVAQSRKGPGSGSQKSIMAEVCQALAGVGHPGLCAPPSEQASSCVTVFGHLSPSLGTPGPRGLPQLQGPPWADPSVPHGYGGGRSPMLRAASVQQGPAGHLGREWLAGNPPGALHWAGLGPRCLGAEASGWWRRLDPGAGVPTVQKVGVTIARSPQKRKWAGSPDSMVLAPLKDRTGCPGLGGAFRLLKLTALLPD